MDIRITKQRLNDHLSYDWIKYLVIVLLSIFLLSLFFTMLAPRIPQNKVLEIYIYAPNYSEQASNQLIGQLKKNRDAQRISDVSIQFFSSRDSKNASILTTRFAAQQGDMVWMDHQVTSREDDQTKTKSSFLNYVDIGMYECLEDALLEIEVQTFDESSVRAWIKEEWKFNQIDSEADMQSAILTAKKNFALLKDSAYRLMCYLGMRSDTNYPLIANLAIKYRRGEQSGDSTQANTPEKIWGLNLASIDSTEQWVLTKLKNLIPIDQEEKSVPNTFACGMVFRQKNVPHQNETVRAFTEIVEYYR